MLRTILIGLDGSDYSHSAMEVGIFLARKTNAMLVGLGIVDETAIRDAEPSLLASGVPYAEPVLVKDRIVRARQDVANLLGQFSRRCAEAGVSFKVMEDVGTPHERIEIQAQRHDLILMGQQTRFHFETQTGYDDTVHRVLKDSPRPVIAVPAKLEWTEDPGHTFLVAYDGSLQSARALHAFQTSGLAGIVPTVIVTVAAEHIVAARTAERAVDFLRSHEIQAEVVPVVSHEAPAQVILATARRRNAAMIVMGGYGQPVLREFFLGSVTKSLLARSPIPLFLYH